MKHLLSIILLVLFPIVSFSQIKIDKAGDKWELQIDSALQVIAKYDSAKMEIVESVCKRISVWANTISSNEFDEKGNGVILVSSADLKLKNINDIAAVIVHESLHLYFKKNNIFFASEDAEEIRCYKYELDFLMKLPNPEIWLVKHAINQIMIRENRIPKSGE